MKSIVLALLSVVALNAQASGQGINQATINMALSWIAANPSTNFLGWGNVEFIGDNPTKSTVLARIEPNETGTGFVVNLFYKNIENSIFDGDGAWNQTKSWSSLPSPASATFSCEHLAIDNFAHQGLCSLVSELKEEYCNDPTNKDAYDAWVGACAAADEFGR